MEGIPKFNRSHNLDKYAICLREKLNKSPTGSTTFQRAKHPNQGISIDFGFIVQASSANPDWVSQLQGINGQTCYCLIADHYTGALYSKCFQTKADSIQFINSWIAKHSPPTTITDKYVQMDLGGELGQSKEVVALFERANYNIKFTSPNHSHQNGPVEQPHRTIAAALQTMLHGAQLKAKYWPYAFHHYL